MFPYPDFQQELGNMLHYPFVYHQISIDLIFAFQILIHQSPLFYQLLPIVKLLKFYSDINILLHFKGNNYQFLHDVLSSHRK